MIKLALLVRAGDDPQDLLSRQRAAFGPLAAALADRVHDTTGMDRTVALWRHEMISAITPFLNPAAGMPRPGS
jgi:hypothetical protein